MRRIGWALIAAGIATVVVAFGLNVAVDPSIDPTLGVPVANTDLMEQRAMIHAGGWALQLMGVILLGFSYVRDEIRSSAGSNRPTN